MPIDPATIMMAVKATKAAKDQVEGQEKGKPVIEPQAGPSPDDLQKLIAMVEQRRAMMGR